MFIFLVLISFAGENISPWGAYSTEERAMEEQLICRQVYDGRLDKGVFGMETCEIWRYKLDSDEHRWFPRPIVPQPPTEMPED